VIFGKGFFNDTMPPLRNVIDKLSIIRFDGDMYESAVDVLYNLYDKLEVGGYFIVDDWTGKYTMVPLRNSTILTIKYPPLYAFSPHPQTQLGFPSQVAINDFFKVHGFHPKMVRIDGLSAYWQKTVPTDVQYWRYEQSQFKP